MKRNKSITEMKIGRNLLKPQKVYFSEAQDTIDKWTGGNYYKHLFAIEVLGIKLELWKAK